MKIQNIDHRHSFRIQPTMPTSHCIGQLYLDLGVSDLNWAGYNNLERSHM